MAKNDNVDKAPEASVEKMELHGVDITPVKVEASELYNTYGNNEAMIKKTGSNANEVDLDCDDKE